MSVRVIQKTDLNAVPTMPPENCATLENSAATNSSCDSAIHEESSKPVINIERTETPPSLLSHPK